MILLDLFLSFARVGLFTFGGGYAMLPLIENEIIQGRGWLTLEQFTDMVAIAEVTPGPIAVNSATFVGYRLASVLGGVVATLGVVTPSVLIMLALAMLARRFEESAALCRIKAGMRPAVAGLIAAAAISVARVSLRDLKSVGIAAAAAGMLFGVKMDPILVLIISGVLGVFIFA
ncbi:MAG: chromate transporter [Clostridia bacterium]|nr:chromate transporter [Clostridia bacterium]